MSYCLESIAMTAHRTDDVFSDVASALTHFPLSLIVKDDAIPSIQMTLIFVWFILLTCFLIPCHADAQVYPDAQQGVTPGVAYHVGDFDHVNLSNGNLNINIPLISYPQVGGKLHFGFHIGVNTKSWALRSVTQNSHSVPVIARRSPGVQILPDRAYQWQHSITYFCDPGDDLCHYPPWTDTYIAMGINLYVAGCSPLNGQTCYPVDSFTIIDQDGGSHLVALSGNRAPNGFGPTGDGSGLSITTSGIRDKDGVSYGFSDLAPYTLPIISAGSEVDPAGNTIKLDTSGWHDTLGNNIPVASVPFSLGSTTSWFIPANSVSVSASRCTDPNVNLAYSIVYPGPAGSILLYDYCFSNIHYASQFNDPGVSDAQGTQEMLTSVVLPDNTSWIFQYDSWGDIYKVMMPTGGSVTYTLASRGPGTFSRELTKKVVEDGEGNVSVWQYSNYNGPVKITNPDGSYELHSTTEWGGESEADYYDTPAGNGVLLKKSVVPLMN